MRVWTDDGFEATYETAQLHAKYLAAASVDQRYDVVANYTVCIVVDFLNRVDGACLAGFAMCPRGSGRVTRRFARREVAGRVVPARRASVRATRGYTR